MIIFISIIIVIISIWLVTFIFLNDFSVPTLKIKNIENVLVIYSHGDDESINTGGLLYKLSCKNIKTTFVVLTKGEKGNQNAHLDLKLKSIREKETKDSAEILKINNLIQEDFGDGQLINKKLKLTKYLDNLLKTKNPDLVITYDLSGMYGHPDHIIVSEIITNLIKNKYKNISLWYPSFPQKVYKMMSLSEHMAKDIKFKNKRSYPNFKVFVLAGLIPKIKSVYAHKSQYESFRNSVPFKFVPLWFIYSLAIFEYYAKAN